jgi:membrane protease subunit (stomatin/prohibitin family)
MSLLPKNPNENLYPTGKKTILTIIKNEASPDVVLWRVPYEDFNEGSKVIVAENEEALFYKNGVVEHLFTAGEYKLSTNNYVFLSRIRNSLSGGISAYNCRIIYVNKIHNLNNKWGTDGPIQVVDNVFGLQVNLQARGAYTIKIEDSKKFYMKFAGSTASSMTADDIAKDMRPVVIQKIKTVVANVIKGMEGEILGIVSRLEEISDLVFSPMQDAFAEYGLSLVNLYIEALEIIEDESYLILKNARARRAEVAVLGADYGRVKTSDIMMASAQNEGGAAGAGLGIGAGIAMGGIMGGSAGGLLSPLSAQQPQQVNQIIKIMAPCGHLVEQGQRFCPDCGKPVSLICPDCGKDVVPGSRFCPNCGRNLS